MEGEALDGSAFTSPDGFAGARTIALVGFAVEHRAELESWVPYLERLLGERTDVRARLFVVLDARPKLLRKMMVAAMRKAVPKAELRAATVVAFTGVEAFCRELAIDRSQLAVFVVEPGGRVAWRGRGAFSEPVGEAIATALAA